MILWRGRWRDRFLAGAFFFRASGFGGRVWAFESPRAPAFLAKAARHSFSDGGLILSAPFQILLGRQIPMGEGCYTDCMTYVYLLRSIGFPHQCYLGCTNNLKIRLSDHNAGRSPHTARYRPWNLVCYTGFADETKARSFEQYLKSGSGRAFRSRHLR
jgi:putative endonuclease